MQYFIHSRVRAPTPWLAGGLAIDEEEDRAKLAASPVMVIAPYQNASDDAFYTKVIVRRAAPKLHTPSFLMDDLHYRSNHSAFQMRYGNYIKKHGAATPPGKCMKFRLSALLAAARLRLRW